MILPPIILYFFISYATASSALDMITVNCTWPCPNSADVCQVTDSAIQCAPSSNSQWVMKTSTTSPVFTGDTATVNQPCISAPNPIKATQPYTNITSSKPTTSNIAWPLQDSERPFDAFLSNCDSTSYCSPDNSQCIPRISQDGYCNSTNECSNEQQCISGRCNGGETTWAPQGPQTSHLLAGIISAIVAVIAGIIAAVFYIRRRRRQAQQGSMAKKETVQDTLASFEQCYESDHTTPAMQQRHLQMRLQQEHSIGDKGDMSSSPPPYSP